MLDLEDLGERLREVDELLVDVVRRRNQLAHLVGAFKQQQGDFIFRESVEQRRIEEIQAVASKRGVSPHLMSGLLYSLINESCKLQMHQIQSDDRSFILPDDVNDRYAVLKQNLIELTSVVARTYDDTREKFPATQAHCVFEEEIVRNMIDELQDRTLALDLGCGTGTVGQYLGPFFTQVQGFDLSQHMVAVASSKAYQGDVSFDIADLEDGIPAANASASLVVMSLGTGSDLPDLDVFIHEVDRVLKPNGRFLLSFYNADALLYAMPFLSLKTGLSAVVDTALHTLTVDVEDREYWVFARPYSWDEIKNKCPDNWKLDMPRTHPTIGSLVPAVHLHDPTAAMQIAELDRSLASTSYGAYLVVTGRKS